MTPDYKLISGLSLGLMILVTGVYLFVKWIREQKSLQERMSIFQEGQMSLTEAMKAIEKREVKLKSDTQKIKQIVMSARGESTTQRSDDPAGLSAGGYIIFDMPDAKKGIFHDLLKGFEDYAKLRGYEIMFSIDNSFANKIAFKFTLDSSGIVVSTKQVRQDLRQCLKKKSEVYLGA